jgi:hypothetical protein
MSPHAFLPAGPACCSFCSDAAQIPTSMMAIARSSRILMSFSVMLTLATIGLIHAPMTDASDASWASVAT